MALVDKQRLVIQRNLVFIQENMTNGDVERCLDVFFQKSRFSQEDTNRIRNIREQNKKCRDLIDTLLQSGQDAAADFIEALDLAGNRHVKQRLEETWEELQEDSTQSVQPMDTSGGGAQAPLQNVNIIPQDFLAQLRNVMVEELQKNNKKLREEFANDTERIIHMISENESKRREDFQRQLTELENVKKNKESDKEKDIIKNIQGQTVAFLSETEDTMKKAESCVKELDELYVKRENLERELNKQTEEESKTEQNEKDLTKERKYRPEARIDEKKKDLQKEEDIQRKGAEIDELKKEITKLRHEVEQERSNTARALSEKRDTYEKNRTRIMELEANLKRKHEDLCKLEKLRGDREELLSKLEKLDQDINSKQEQEKQLEQKLREMRETEKLLEDHNVFTENKSLKKELARLRKTNVDLKVKIGILERHVKRQSGGEPIKGWNQRK